MIFVSVGTELPFDRLIQAMDAWAAEHPDEEVLAQIGRGRYEPRHMRWSRRLGWDDYDAEVAASRLLVAHAGTGSVLTAGEWAKPIVVLPRRGQYGEHRNDHQIGMAAWLRGRPGLFVAETEAHLSKRITEAEAAEGHLEPISPIASRQLLAKLRAFALGVSCVPSEQG